MAKAIKNLKQEKVTPSKTSMKDTWKSTDLKKVYVGHMDLESDLEMNVKEEKHFPKLFIQKPKIVLLPV